MCKVKHGIPKRLLSRSFCIEHIQLPQADTLWKNTRMLHVNSCEFVSPSYLILSYLILQIFMIITLGNCV